MNLSFFVILINPLGWHMFIHIAPLYILFILFKNRYRLKKMKQPYLVYFGLFFLYVLISFVLIGHEKGSVGKVIRYAYEFIVLIFFASLNFQDKEISSYIRAFIYSGCAIAVKMAIQRVHIVTEAHRFTINNFSKLMDPNYLAAYLIFPICILFYMCIKGGFKGKHLIYLLILLAVVFATGSRGAFVAVVLSFGTIYIKCSDATDKKITSFFIILLAVAISFAVLPGSILERFNFKNFNDASNSLRINLWTAAWRIFMQHPIVGSGANSMMNHGLEFGARINLMVHNSYLELLADYGLIGFVFWILAYGAIIKNAIKVSNWFVVSVMLGTLCAAFFITAQDSAFLWINYLMCILMLKNNYQNQICYIFDKKVRREKVNA